MSTCERMRQKWSMPSSMACVMNGRIGATTAPARSNSRAACSTAARTSGSTARPQPASSSRPMRRPLSFSTPWSNWSQAISWNGRLMLSRASGSDSTCMNQAASATLRVIGPGGAAGVGRIDRDAAEAGLEGEDAAPAGRQPQRAADVGSDVQGPVARGRRGAGAGAGAARRLVHVPGVARQLVEARQAGRQHAVVGHGGLGDHHPAGFAHARRRRRIGGRRRQVARRRSQRHRIALGRDVFLEGHGHAVQRAQRLAAQPARLAGAGLRQRQLGAQQIERLQLVLPQLDVAQHRPGDLHRRELAPAVARHQLGRGQFMQCLRVLL